MLADQAEIGLLAKLNVSDVEASVRWYEDSLGLELDPRFSIQGWRQLNVPGVEGAAVGLWQETPTGTGTATITFFVTDIEEAWADLEAKGIKISKPADVGGGVQMCFFTDPDANALSLRQNPPSLPPPSAVGRS
jgi:catechol 2,3-dioxygenase-like lactoylglutathione lyase family enzyme